MCQVGCPVGAEQLEERIFGCRGRVREQSRGGGDRVGHQGEGAQLQVLGRQRRKEHVQAVDIASTLSFLLGDSGLLLTWASFL